MEPLQLINLLNINNYKMNGLTLIGFGIVILLTNLATKLTSDK